MVKTAQLGDFEELHKQLDRMMDRLTRRHFSQFRATESWTPAINAYRMEDRIEVCVDLAGVERDGIDVSIEPGAMVIRGVRKAPYPTPRRQEGVQILVMEIDHGPFERRFALPRQVDVRKITAEQRNGLLWVRLPFSKEKQE